MKSLNPGYKLLSLIIASLLLSVTFNVRLNLLITAMALSVTFLTPGMNRRRLLMGLLPFLITALGMFTAGLYFGSSGSQDMIQIKVLGQEVVGYGNTDTALQLSTRILAYGGLGMFFAFTTSAFDLVISLMRQFHLPPKFAYGILAAYHFFPVICEEYSIVGAAFKVRGIKVSPLSSRRLFPMLAQAMERSASLAMAMESRGFENEAPRAIAFRTKVHVADKIFLVGLNIFIIAGLVFL